MERLNKVIVIGSPGAGKSVFSKRLNEKTGLPLIHLDLIWHKPDKTHIPREQFDAVLERACQEERWIMDGNYSRTLELRFAHADTVIFLDYPPEVCLEGIAGRIGQTRSDMPWVEDCLDPELKQTVEEYPHKNRQTVYRLIKKYQTDKTVVVFHSREDAERYLENLENH